MSDRILFFILGPSRKLKAPNYFYSSTLRCEQVTAAAALYVLDDDLFANRAFLAAPLFHPLLPTAAAASDLDADCRSEYSTPERRKFRICLLCKFQRRALRILCSRTDLPLITLMPRWIRFRPQLR